MSLQSNPMNPPVSVELQTMDRTEEPRESDLSSIQYTKNPNHSRPSDPPSLQYGVTEPSCLGRLDPCTCCPSKTQLHSEPLYNRMILCLFALSLMWGSCLQVCAIIAGAVVSIPEFSAVFDSCEGAYDVTMEEKDDYAQCVQSQLSRCGTNLEQSALRESERMIIANDFNRDLVVAAKETQKTCSSAFTNTRYSLESWSSNFATPGSGITELPYTPSCTDLQKDQITSEIGDISAVRSEAFALSTQYSDDSQGAVDRLSNYAMLRAQYDARYVDNHTQHMQDSFEEWVDGIYLPSLNLNETFDGLFPDVTHLMSCVTPRSQVNESCPYMKSAYEMLEETRSELESARDDARETVDEFAVKAEQYQENVEEAYENSREFYEGVREAVAGAAIDTSGWGDWYNIGLVDIYPNPVNFPSVIPEYPSVPTTDEIWAAVSGNLENFWVNLTDAQTEAARLAQKWKEEVNEQLDSIPSPLPEDYNPPQYVGAPDQPLVTNVTEEKKAHQEKSDAFVEQSAVALDAFDELSQYEEEEFTPPVITFNFSDFANKASEVEWNFETLRGPGFDVNLWFLSFGQITSLLFGLDYAFRAYKSVRLVYYYWTRGAVGIPDVDLSADKEPTNPFKLSTPRLFALIVSSPMTPAVICMFFAVWGGALLSSIYEPLYEEYLSGCVEGGENGTFLTQNVFSVAYNYASQDGNSATFEGIDVYDMRRAEVCSEYGGNSVNQQNKNAGELATLKEAHMKSMAAINTYQICIDVNTLDPQVRGACCGLAGYPACDSALGEPNGYACPLNEFPDVPVPFKVPSSYIMEPTCQTAMVGEDWLLEDAVYNCEELPTCDLSCGGPTRPIMEHVSKQCGCMIEWGAHSIWIQLFLTVIIFVLMNMSRIGLVTGVSKLFWSSLHPGLFTFKGTATRDGELVVGREFAETEGEKEKQLEAGAEKGLGKRFGILIKEGLDKILPKYRLKGVPQVLMGLAINIPWIYALKNLGYNIAYKK